MVLCLNALDAFLASLKYTWMCKTESVMLLHHTCFAWLTIMHEIYKHFFSAMTKGKIPNCCPCGTTSISESFLNPLRHVDVVLFMERSWKGSITNIGSNGIADFRTDQAAGIALRNVIIILQWLPWHHARHSSYAQHFFFFLRIWFASLW